MSSESAAPATKSAPDLAKMLPDLPRNFGPQAAKAPRNLHPNPPKCCARHANYTSACLSAFACHTKLTSREAHALTKPGPSPFQTLSDPSVRQPWVALSPPAGAKTRRGSFYFAISISCRTPSHVFARVLALVYARHSLPSVSETRSSF